jgi:hypothetical protein
MFEQTKTASAYMSRSYFHETIILTPLDWEHFKTAFNKQYPGFFVGLHGRYPKFTPSEIRLVTLLKLQFTIKMMAKTLGVSPQSIIKGRYRLKKKLQLPEGADLETIILQL